MSTNILNLGDAQKKRSSKDIPEEERREIMAYLKAHPEDKDAISYLMKKHNCSNTTIGILIIKDEQGRLCE